MKAYTDITTKLHLEPTFPNAYFRTADDLIYCIKEYIQHFLEMNNECPALIVLLERQYRRLLVSPILSIEITDTANNDYAFSSYVYGIPVTTIKDE
jgi:hypothetical protein